MELTRIDLWKHAAVGFVLTLVVGFALHAVIGLLAAAAVGWFKEDWWDKGRGKGTKDGWDAFATLLGGVPAVAILSSLS